MTPISFMAQRTQLRVAQVAFKAKAAKTHENLVKCARYATILHFGKFA